MLFNFALCASFSFLCVFFGKKKGISGFQFFVLFLCLCASLTALNSQSFLRVFISLEVLTVLYAILIAWSGSVKLAALYAAVNLGVGVALLSIIPTGSILEGVAFSYLYNTVFSTEILVLVLAVHAGMLLMMWIVARSYEATGIVIASFVSIFASKVSLLLLRDASGSEILFISSIVAILYSIYHLLYEENIFRALVIWGIGQVALCGLVIYYGGEAEYYLIPSVLYQSAYYIYNAKLHECGIKTFSELKRCAIKPSITVVLMLISTLCCLGFPMTLGFAMKSVAMKSISSYGHPLTYLQYLFVFLWPLKTLVLSLQSQGHATVKMPLKNSEKIAIFCMIFFLVFPLSFADYTIVKVSKNIATAVLIFLFSRSVISFLEFIRINLRIIDLSFQIKGKLQIFNHLYCHIKIALHELSLWLGHFMMNTFRRIINSDSISVTGSIAILVGSSAILFVVMIIINIVV